MWPPAMERRELSPLTVVTLVHGTFATEAAWTRDDSAMRTAWPGAGDHVSFSVFNWSGDNSHLARLAAAEQLREHLRTVIDAAPAADHVIVAHSHGGNVALAALGDRALAARVRGLACLNTPFIQCAPRSLLPFELIMLALNPFAWLMLVTPLAFERYVVPRYPESYMTAWLIGGGLLFLAMWPFAAAGWAVFRVTERWRAAIGRSQYERVEKLRVTNDAPPPVLAATVPRDEAYAYLTTLDRITATAAGILMLAQWLFVGGVISYLIAGSGGLLTDFNWFPGLTRLAFMMSRWATAAVLAGVLVFLVAVLAVTLVGVLVRGRRYGYGEALADSLLLDIRISRQPAAPINADLRVFAVAPGGGLRHSALYDSPELVRALAEWVDRTPAHHP